MPVVYVTEQRSIIRKTSDRLVVEKEGTVLMEIPCLKIDTILIFGNVQVTTQALGAHLDPRRRGPRPIAEHQDGIDF